MPMYIHDDRSAMVIGINVSLVVLATLAVTMRLMARLFAKAGIKADDVCIIVALAFTYAVCIIEGVATKYGLGRHIWTLSPQTQQNYGRVTWIETLFYAPGLCFSRLSILLLYRRIFITPRFKEMMIVMMVIVIALAVGTELAFLLKCTSLKSIWNHTMEGSHCVNLDLVFKLTASLAICIDVAILVIPTPTVWKLKMNTRRKAALSGIFFVGGLACVTAMVRLAILQKITKASLADGTWTNNKLSQWSNAEPCIEILCASLPVMGPLFRRALEDRSNTPGSNGVSSGYGSSATGSKVCSKSLGQRSGTKFNMLDPASESKEGFQPYDAEKGVHKSEVSTATEAARESDDSWPMQGNKAKSDVEWVSANKS